MTVFSLSYKPLIGTNSLILTLVYPPLHVDRPWCRKGAQFEHAWFFGSQSEYVTDGVHLDVLLPNFIISFENLESDFKCMTTLLGLPANLKHKNPSVLVEGEFETDSCSPCSFLVRSLKRSSLSSKLRYTVVFLYTGTTLLVASLHRPSMFNEFQSENR